MGMNPRYTTDQGYYEKQGSSGMPVVTTTPAATGVNTTPANPVPTPVYPSAVGYHPTWQGTTLMASPERLAAWQASHTAGVGNPMGGSQYPPVPAAAMPAPAANLPAQAAGNAVAALNGQQVMPGSQMWQPPGYAFGKGGLGYNPWQQNAMPAWQGVPMTGQPVADMSQSAPDMMNRMQRPTASGYTPPAYGGKGGRRYQPMGGKGG